MLLHPLGIAGFQEIYPLDLPQPAVVDRLTQSNAGVAWLFELEPLMAEPEALPLIMTPGPGLGALGVVGFADLFALTAYRPAPAPIERHLTAARGVNTLADDDPPEVRVDNRLRVDRVRIARELPRVMDRLGGFVSETSAEVTLDGIDGGLDHLFTDRVLRDQPCRLKLAPTTPGPDGVEIAPALSSFAVAFEGRIGSAEITPDGEVRLRLVDGFDRLDRPIQQSLYFGTGGREGPASLEGQPKPLNYGTVTATEPTLVDPLRGIWQIHDGEFLAILVKDKGVPLVQGRDVPTYEALEALAVEGETDEPDLPLGMFATCFAEGYFRLAGWNGPVTCDVQGDGLYDGPIGFEGGVFFEGGVGYEAPGARTHRRRAGGMIYRILTTRAAFRDGELDLDGMLQFDDRFPYEQGISFPTNGGRPTVREGCTRIADSVGAIVPRNQFGQITLREIAGPALASQVRITDRTLTEHVERVPLPWGAPWPAVQITYAPNERPLTDEEVAADLTGDALEEAKRTSGMVSASDARLAALLPDRAPLVIESRLRDRNDALEVAHRLLGFYGSRWTMYRITSDAIAFRTNLLFTVEVAVSRWGLDLGVPMQVFASDERPANIETSLLLL